MASNQQFRSQNFLLALVVVCMGTVWGCSLPAVANLPASLEETIPAYQTVAVLLTQTAHTSVQPAQSPTAPETPAPDDTPQPVATDTSVVLTLTSATANNNSVACDLAAAGIPFDVTIPDDAQMAPGESFVKTWRLVNTGSCVWTREYAVVFFSGFDMGLRREEPFRNEVRPGESVDISLDMVAPRESGSYQGNYKLRGQADELFGIGPEGSSPFWVRVEVMATQTPTPTVAPSTLTPTVAVYTSGGAALGEGQAFDLDAGVIGAGDGDDFALQQGVESLEWVPTHEARVLLVGAVEPGFEVCNAALLSTEPLVLGGELEGSYLCVRTSQGLPARVYLEHIDSVLSTLNFQYVVWSVP